MLQQGSGQRLHVDVTLHSVSGAESKVKQIFLVRRYWPLSYLP